MPEPTTHTNMERHTIVVAGAGFAGITTALHLARRLRGSLLYQIILIDRHDYQLYTPSLYEIAAIPYEEASAFTMKSTMAIPIERIIAGTSIKFLQATLSGIDQENHILILEDNTTVAYEYLVLALGSETSYFDIPGLETYAHPLKRFEDAVRIRNKIETILREQRRLRIVVGGGGPSGVELIAEFSNFLCLLQNTIAPELKSCDHELMLVEAGEDILRGFDLDLVRRARKRLQALGVQIKAGIPIVRASEKNITLKDDTEISYDILVWTGGVMGLPMFKKLGLPLTPRGNFVVNEFFEAAPRIFAIGDAAGFLNPKTGKPLPWNVPVAEAEGHFIARTIISDIRGQSRKSFHAHGSYPFILAVGGKYAIADLILFKFWGGLGWFTKLLVELRYLFFILKPLDALRLWQRKIRLYLSNDVSKRMMRENAPQ